MVTGACFDSECTQPPIICNWELTVSYLVKVFLVDECIKPNLRHFGYTVPREPEGSWDLNSCDLSMANSSPSLTC